MYSCKDATGYLRSRPTSSLPTCPPVSPILGASSNKAKEDSFTGKLLSVASDLEDLHGYEKPSDPFMPSFRDRRQPTSTFGKKIQGLKERSLKSEANPFEETKEEIGNKFGNMRLPGISEPFLPIFEYVVIVHSKKSAKTTFNQLRWSAPVQFYGVQLAWESQGGLGMKLECKLILRIHERSSGVDMEVRSTLLSMNFEEESILPIYYDGWIGIRCEWKLKEEVSHCLQRDSGLRRTSIPDSGIQI